MKINHNGKSYNLPASLEGIPLKQVQGFHLLYGKDIEEYQAKSDDELDSFEIMMDLACKSVSFFSGIPLEEMYRTDLSQVMGIYQQVLEPLFNPQEERAIQERYFFKDSLWAIASPELTFKNTMTFNELILGKEITKDLKNFAAGKFDALQRLAVIYFRKVDADGNMEPVDESWLNEELEQSERLQLMAELPMDIALDVAFFLQSSMSLFLQSSQFLGNQEPKEKDPISPNTSISGAGSPS